MGKKKETKKKNSRYFCKTSFKMEDFDFNYLKDNNLDNNDLIKELKRAKALALGDEYPKLKFYCYRKALKHVGVYIDEKIRKMQFDRDDESYKEFLTEKCYNKIIHNFIENEREDEDFEQIRIEALKSMILLKEVLIEIDRSELVGLNFCPRQNQVEA